MTRLRFAGIHEYADGIAYMDFIKRCVVTTLSLLYGSTFSLIGCVYSAVLCGLAVCLVTVLLSMSFFSSSQTALVFVMCDSASLLHICFIIIYCYDADTFKLLGPLYLLCRPFSHPGICVIASVILLLTITLTISPSSYHWPCRNNSSLFCRYSWLRLTALSTPAPAVDCHHHKVCGDNFYHCSTSMAPGCLCVPVSH